MSKIGILRHFVFSLPLSEANFKYRGFEEGEPSEKRLELVAKTVIKGYNTALETGLSESLEDSFLMINKEICGFFNEGVGMGLYTLDLFMLNKKDRFWNFIKDNKIKGKDHEYMSYIGAGIACGVFNKPFKNFLDIASPTCGALILNGVGFYFGYFKQTKGIDKQYVRNDVLEDEFYLESYDNGIGRALWFCKGGNPYKIAETIKKFPQKRQSSIWSGVGLAATYAGGVEEEKIIKLKEFSGNYAEYLGEGSFLATHTRCLAGNSHESDATEQILIGKTSKEACYIAHQFHEELNMRRYIDGKHSLKVFYEKIRTWIKE